MRLATGTFGLLFLLGGCAGPSALVPQESTATQVRDRMGAPTDIRFDRNGDELWEYATGPAGTQTWLVRLGPDGRVKERVQLLTAENFARIVPGKSSKRDVRDILGRPGDQSYFHGEAVWEWRMQDSPRTGRYMVRFTVDNVVKEALVLLDPSEGDGRRRSRTSSRSRD